jgi:hypothetical protein
VVTAANPPGCCDLLVLLVGEPWNGPSPALPRGGCHPQALKLNPDSAIARVEYANGLIMLFGKGRLGDAAKLYEEAAACKPADAMERLDVELARSELE